MSSDNLSLIYHPDAYSDCFVVLDPVSATLTVKNYYILKPANVIPLSSLRYIIPAKQVLHRWGLRQHGYSHGVRWAKDDTRGNFLRGPKSGYDRSFVLKANGTFTRCGFSVEDPARFLAVLERLRPGVTTKTTGKHTQEHVGHDLIKEL